MEENGYTEAPVGPKTALVSIVGRPSSGKSTFLNTASGEKVSIVSKNPQTTRNAIRGIVNTSLGQIVFIDTPGLHVSEKKMNLRLTQIAAEQIAESDAILYVVDSTRDYGEEESLIANMLLPYSHKVVVAINKIDAEKAAVQKADFFIHAVLPAVPQQRIVHISAKADEHINDVLRALYDLAPEAPHLYPEDLYTDQEVAFRISEIIREEAINRLSQEIPHALYVSIDEMNMQTHTKMAVRATLYVERESQKGIVIGKNASMIREIRKASAKQCRDIFPYWVELDLRVKVDKNWRQKDTVLARLLS